MKKFMIFLGNYGSGKTELAINFALDAAKHGKTLLIDLDMINCYFRLYDRRSLLEDAGIEIVAPYFADSGEEMLTIPAEMTKAFDMDWDTVIIDLGGDSGALALGQFHHKLKIARENGAEIALYNVINACRLMSDAPKKVIRLMEQMERKARWEITGLINNTNMSYETTAGDLEAGYEIIRQVAEVTGLPVVYTCGKTEVLTAFLKIEHKSEYVGMPFYMETYMHRDWDTLAKKGV